MVWPNEEPRDYEFRFVIENPFSRDVTGYLVRALSLWQWTLGVAYSGTGTKRGCQLTATCEIASGEPVVGYSVTGEIRFETWWDADLVIPVSSWIAPTGTYEIVVRVFGLVLEVTDCDAWEVSFDALELWVNGFKEYETGAQSDSGTGWDTRLNRVFWEPDPTTSPVALPAKPGCASVAHNVQVACEILGGYRYAPEGTTDWEYDLVDIEQYPVPEPAPVMGCAECDCEAGVPRPSLADRPEGTDSWYVSMRAESVDVLTKPFLGQFSCHCDPPGTVPWIWSVWHPIRHTFRHERLYGSIDPVGKGVTRTQYDAGSKCYCDPGAEPGFTTTTDTVDEPVTKMRYRGEVLPYHFVGESMCCQLDQTGNCPIVDPEDPPPVQPTCQSCSGAADPDYLCIWQSYVEVSHPAEPPCVSGLLSYDVSPGNRHAIAVHVDSDDELHLQVSQNAKPRLTWNSPVAAGFDAVDACIRWLGGQGVLGCLYAKPGGGIGWRTTSDEGGAWSSETLLSATGTRAGFLFSASRGLYLYWIDAGAIKGQVWDAGFNVLRSTFTLLASGADDYTLAVDENFGAAGARTVRFQFVGGGQLTEMTSTDGENLS